MKINKEKKKENPCPDKNPSGQTKLPQKSNKKLKLNSTETENGIEATSQSTPTSDNPLKAMDNNIFKYFKELTSDEEKIRMEAALQLLKQLNRTKDPEKRQKELSYTMKRLIRGCGASTNVSRAGFFTCLVGLLKSFSYEEITMQVVLQILNKELHIGTTIANKEDADAIVGKILVCGALLHSGRLVTSENEHLEQVTNILLQSLRHRTYHASLGFSFLCEIIETLSQKQFECSVWPLLQKELIKPWSKQSLQTVHCLMSIQKKFPHIIDKKFLKTNFGGSELLNPESFPHLYKIFWEHSNTDVLTHPAFECFGSYIGTSKHLVQFWNETVDPGLEHPTKLLEIETLKILTDILDNLSLEHATVYQLLTDNFMRMFIDGLKTLKQKKNETLKAFYTDFLEALVKSCRKLTKDTDKVSAIKRLILPPGIFNIEKFTGHRIIHQLINTLGEDGVKEVFKLYKNIFLGTIDKNPENSTENWLNFERLNAGYMLQHLLQHKSVQQSYKWRCKQLKFLLTCGIFYVTDSAEICKKEAAGTFCKDFAEQCKSMFYTCLQSKLSDISQEQKLLYDLAEFCQEKILQKHAAKYFRTQKFDDFLQKSWKKMFDSVSQTINTEENNKMKSAEATSKRDNKLQTVFNILLLTMGLQLFREPEMAGPAIEDLLKCMEKTSQQTKTKKKFNKDFNQKSELTAEPEWIEVVVDLFLHLLSQNNNALRNIVNALFPHLCGSLSLSAVHQILVMLDMKDGNNPLTTSTEDKEEDDDAEDQEEVNTYENGLDAETDDEDDNDEDDDEDDDDEDDVEDGDEAEDDENENDVTASDKLRNAISQALIENGSAVSVDDDMESIDLNEMTEEEGHQLDEALANAFRALKKSGGGGSQIKKSKKYRVKATTVMHFRIRVLDLIEIYLQNKPSVLISIEIMLVLYNMLEYCVGNELKPLQVKVEKVLTKLTNNKNYTTDDNVKDENFVDLIRVIVEKKAPAVVYDIVNKMRNKCTCFLISSAHKMNADKSTGEILKLCQEYADEFIKSRNPVINISLLSDIFKLRWPNVWNIAENLAQRGLNLQTRIFRRIQIYEILTVLYKNNELLKQDEEMTRKHLKKIEKTLSTHINTLCENDAVKHSPKEFQSLVDLILIAENVHQRLQLQTLLTSETTLNSIQNLRKLIRLESLHAYQRFCKIFKQQIIRNADVPNKSKTEQKDSASEIESEEDKQEIKPESLSQKRKLSSKDLRKLKKQKKENRLEAVSRGLNGGIEFAHTNGNNSKFNGDVSMDNEDAN